MSADVEVQDCEVEFDLSKLIDLSVTFQPLQLTLQDILRRLVRLERENDSKTSEINHLNAEIDDLKKRQSKTEREVEEATGKLAEAGQRDSAEGSTEDEGVRHAADVQEKRPFSTGKPTSGGERGCADDEHARMWEEIEGLKEILSALQDIGEEQRHSIDELYAACKRRASMAPSTISGHAASRSGDRPVSGARRTPFIEEGEVSVGDKILQLAHEDLHLRNGKHFGDDSEAQEEVEPEHPQQQQPAEQPTEHRRQSSEAARRRSTPRQVDTREDGGLLTQHEELQEELPSSTRRPLGAPNTNTSVTVVPPPATNPHDGEQESSSAGEHMQPPTQRPVSAISDGSKSAHTTSVSGLRGEDDDTDTFALRPFETYKPDSGRRPPRSAGSTRQSVSQQLVGKMKRDGDDISYLNRVVAEILGEMKDLHADVDLLRTHNGASDLGMTARPRQSDPDAAGARNAPHLDDLSRRVRAVEQRVEEVSGTSDRRDGDLQAQVDDLRKATRAASRLTDEDVDRLDTLSGLLEQLRDLERRVQALEGANDRLGSKLDSVLDVAGAGGSDDAAAGVNAAQFALLKGTVDALERQLAELQSRPAEKDWSEEMARLSAALDRLRDEVDHATALTRSVEAENRRLEDVKANRSELGLQESTLPAPGGVSAETGALLEELLRRLTALTGRMEEADGKIACLAEEKADRTALQRLRDDLNNLKRLMELNAQRDAARESSGEGSAPSALTEQLLREMQQQLMAQSESSHTDREAAQDELEALRELIEQLNHRKADATLVANKAERDYVENALERLMREVEQVLNATNAGLIDTLDKSLNILRDMIDGKATKQDIARLQQIMAEDGTAGAAGDGLTGFRGYRCLGCNRPMESLRPRTLPSKMQPFLNRNPQNYPRDNVTRSIQQQQQATALLEQHSQSRLVRSADQASGSPRSVYSEPLPPIEERH